MGVVRFNGSNLCYRKNHPLPVLVSKSNKMLARFLHCSLDCKPFLIVYLMVDIDALFAARPYSQNHRVFRFLTFLD